MVIHTRVEVADLKIGFCFPGYKKKLLGILIVYYEQHIPRVRNAIIYFAISIPNVNITTLFRTSMTSFALLSTT